MLVYSYSTIAITTAGETTGRVWVLEPRVSRATREGCRKPSEKNLITLVLFMQRNHCDTDVY